MSKKISDRAKADRAKATTEWLNNDFKFNPTPSLLPSKMTTSPKIDEIPASGPGKRQKPITREVHEGERKAMVRAYGLGERNEAEYKGKRVAPVDRGKHPARRPRV